MKILNLFLVFVLAAQTQFVFARSQGNANMYDATDTSYRAAADAQQRELMTIREAAIQAQAAANKGKSMANAAVGVTAAGVAATCWTSFFGGASLCKYFVGGLAASVAVRLLMSNAGGTSGSTIGAVTTTDDPYNLGHGPNNTSQKPDYAEEPEYKDAQKVLTKLKNEGWKIDLKSGMITPPKGKAYSSSIASSPAAMRASGASEADIKAYQDAMSKIPAIAAAKAADSGSVNSGEDVGASVSAKPVAAAAVGEGDANFGNQNLSAKTMGVNRDPAQIAGLSTNYNGSPIGVSGDSLFLMIDRRYQYHDKNGSFISGR